jgi:hypothetical protein
MRGWLRILTDLYFHQRTADVKDAGTDDDFTLLIQSQGQTAILEFDDNSGNDREMGESDSYQFDLRNFNFDHEMIKPGDLAIITHGKDAWLPEAFFVTGGFGDGVIEEDVVLVDVPHWSDTNWFSLDPEDEGQSYWSLGPVIA